MMFDFMRFQILIILWFVNEDENPKSIKILTCFTRKLQFYLPFLKMTDPWSFHNVC